MGEPGRLTNIRKLIRTSRPIQVALMMFADATVVSAAAMLAYFARFEGIVDARFTPYMWPYVVAAVVVYLGLFKVLGIYRIVLRYVGIESIMRLALAIFAAVLVLTVVNAILSAPGGWNVVPYSVILITGVLALVGAGALRSVSRMSVAITMSEARRRGTPVLVIGAGDAGSLLLRDIENRPDSGMYVVGLLDDDAYAHGMTVRGVPVLGPVSALEEVAATHDVAEVFIAILSLSAQRKREILEMCTRAGLKTRIMGELAGDSTFTGIADLRNVSIDDLLGRDPVQIDVDLISSAIEGRVVAVTGAAGSIGSELCRQIIKMRPQRLLLLEVDETRLYEMGLELERVAPGVASMRICDVRDRGKLDRVFGQMRPDVVFHAAAYKHVPLMEDEPDEAVRTNVLGTRNVLEACRQAGVGKFVLISTDKAVDPCNVMGATKAMAERLMLAYARDGMQVTAVRFGNVLGSRGSVVPIFEEQLKNGGPVLVTDPEVTRYFMTIPEAVRLVLQAQAMSEGGDIFVLEMGVPVRIVELAKRMIALSGVPASIEFTGLRPGEKLHEILVHGCEELLPTACSAVVRLSHAPEVGDDFLAFVDELGRVACGGEVDEVARMLLDRLCSDSG